MMGIALSFLGTRWGKIIAACVAGAIALTVNNSVQRSAGAKKAVAKIEKKERKNVRKARVVRDKSSSSTSGGLRDPYTSTDN